MTARRETCRWVTGEPHGEYAITIWGTECRTYGSSIWFAKCAEDMPKDCPHCGGRIVREGEK